MGAARSKLLLLQLLCKKGSNADQKMTWEMCRRHVALLFHDWADWEARWRGENWGIMWCSGRWWKALMLIGTDSSRRAIRAHADGMPVKSCLTAAALPARVIVDMLRCYSRNNMGWCGETGSPGKTLQTQWNLAKVQCRASLQTTSSLTQEGWFVEHPNILFGQRMLLGRRPNSPFVEFQEVAAAFKGHK